MSSPCTPLLRCAMCRRPVPDDEVVIIGEIAVHRNCEQNWDARHGAEIKRLAADDRGFLPLSGWNF